MTTPQKKVDKIFKEAGKWEFDDTQKENSWEERDCKSWTKFKENWEIEFDEKFLKYLGQYKDVIDINTLGVPLIPNEIKSFISNLLSQARREERQKVVEWAVKKKLKPDSDNPTPLDREEIAYNQALSDLLTNLKNK